jgi:glycosyltransferase involved in cell wall biosynthesis
VREQKYPDVEHIVIDGGSTDGTIEILQRYPDIKWISEPDSGLTDALNKGLRLSTREIIGWLNSDDYYLPGSFHAIDQAFSAQTNVDVIYGDIWFVDVNGNLHKRLINTEFDPRILMFYRNYIPSNGAFWRRKIIDDGHLPDASFKVIMDWDWWLQLFVSGYTFGFIPRNLSAFRMRDDNVSNTMAHLIPGEHERLRKKFEHHFRGHLTGKFERKVLFSAYKCKRVLRKVQRLMTSIGTNEYPDRT